LVRSRGIGLPAVTLSNASPLDPRVSPPSAWNLDILLLDVLQSSKWSTDAGHGDLERRVSVVSTFSIFFRVGPLGVSPWLAQHSPNMQSSRWGWFGRGEHAFIRGCGEPPEVIVARIQGAF
jgi:hypothetical protein